MLSFAKHGGRLEVKKEPKLGEPIGAFSYKTP